MPRPFSFLHRTRRSAKPCTWSPRWRSASASSAAWAQVVVHGEGSLPGVDLGDSLGVLGGYLAPGPSLYWQAQEVSGGEAQDHAQCPVFQVGEASCGAGEQADGVGGVGDDGGVVHRLTLLTCSRSWRPLHNRLGTMKLYRTVHQGRQVTRGNPAAAGQFVLGDAQLVRKRPHRVPVELHPGAHGALAPHLGCFPPGWRRRRCWLSARSASGENAGRESPVGSGG